jgi:predicted HAD superfamily phosphohydrolase YqeG
LLDRKPAELAAAGILVLALDFDGVLAPHGADQPLPEVVDWLQRAAEVFGQERIFILSNCPFGPRIEWFAANFPGVRFVWGVRKKPYPDGLKKTGELASVPLSEILMVDDRLLTGCLSAVLAGARPFYVRQPYLALRSNLRKELFFMLLRWSERLYVAFLP